MSTVFRMDSPLGSASQRGVALFTALIILVVLTLVTLASLSTSMLELRMSTNEESRSTAFQTAQAAIDNVIYIDYLARQPLTLDETKQYFKIAGPVGYSQCTPKWSGGGCDTTNIVLTSPLDGTSSGLNQVKIKRLNDPVSTRNANCPSAATFQLESTYDRSALGFGKSGLVQGYVACDYLNPQQQPIMPKQAENN